MTQTGVMDSNYMQTENYSSEATAFKKCPRKNNKLHTFINIDDF